MTGFPVATAHGLAWHCPPGPTHIAHSAFAEWVARSDASGISFHSLQPEIFSSLQNRSNNLPAKPFFLTCDDALASVAKIAELLSGPATLFVVTDYVGKSNQWPGQPAWVPREQTLDWSEIKTLADRGWTIAAHSCTHPSFHRLNAREMRHEIRCSVETIEDKTGRPCRFFAYPYGHAPDLARNIIADLNLFAFTTEPGWVCANSNPTALPRFDIHDLAKPGRASKWAFHQPHPAEMHWLKFKRAVGTRLKQGRAL